MEIKPQSSLPQLQNLEYAAKRPELRPDRHLVVASIVLFLTFATCLSISIVHIIWPLDDRDYGFNKVMGLFTLICVACPAISLFARSRAMTAVTYFVSIFVSFLSVANACLNSEAPPPLRVIAALMGVAFFYVAWAYYQWGCRLRDWKSELERERRR